MIRQNEAESNDSPAPVGRFADSAPGRLRGAKLHPWARRDVPLIAHVIYRFDVGGLENGLVNLINRIPAERYRHAVICLTEYTDFRSRVHRPDVEYFALHKHPGKDFGHYLDLYQLLRKLRPSVVHTRNLPALESQAIAWMAGVPGRVHGEHGRDIYDLDGTSTKYNLLRRGVRPFVQQYIALSQDLEGWLRSTVRVPAPRLTQIYNGVDADRFHPAIGGRERLPHPSFAPPGTFVIGCVGRMEKVKDTATLVRSVGRVVSDHPELKGRVRLVLVGDGPLRAQVAEEVVRADIGTVTWLAGSRDDVPALMRGMDLFVLPSLAEGISNTVLEAMATGLPVVATRVGGNPELVVEGETGRLVPPSDAIAMAAAIHHYVRTPELARAHGQSGRERIEARFSMPAMVSQYLSVYDGLLGRQG